MINIYKKSNLNYRMNGDYMIDPIIAKLRLKLNGSWSIDLEIDQQNEEVCKALQHDSVIKVKLPKYGDQLYVVSDPVRTGFDTVKATAFPIAMWDSRNELVCLDSRPTNMSGEQALNYVLTACGGNGKYKIESDITKASTAYYARKNFMECLAGTDDNSFLNRWGGEIEFDNFTFRVMNHIGSSHKFTLSASRNISGFTISEDDSNFCDVIVPVAFNGRTTGKRVKRIGNNGRVEHVRFVEYPHIKLNDDVTGDAEDIDIVCTSMNELETKLIESAQKDFEDGKYLPSFSYSIDYVDLRLFDQYKDLKNAQTLWLGDTVVIENLDWGMSTTQKVVELTYDLVQDQIESIVLGSYEKNYFDAISSAARSTNAVVSSNGTVIGDKISGIIDMSLTSLRAQKTVSKRADVRGILYEDLLVGSSTYGALCIGTQGLQISKQRNADNTDWIWGTAIDYRSIIADYIITGILSGKNGNFWLNLDTGTYELGDNGLFKGTITTTKDAKIGRNMYLDYDHTGIAESAIFLGDKGSDVLSRPYIYFKAKEDGSINYVGMAHKIGDDILGFHISNGQVYMKVKNRYIRISDKEIILEDADACMRFVDGKIYICGEFYVGNTKDGLVYKGLTYNGAVNNIATINGIVTGVS